MATIKHVSPIKLDEHQVPHLHDHGIVGIDEVGRITVPDPVVVYL